MTLALVSMLLTLLPIPTGNTQRAEDSTTADMAVPQSPLGSGKSQVSRLVMISWDPQVLPLSADSVDLLLRANNAAGDGMRRLRNMYGADMAWAEFGFRSFDLPPNSGSMIGLLTIEFHDLKAKPDDAHRPMEVLGALREQLERLLTRAHDMNVEQLGRNLAQAKAGVEAAAERLKDIQALESKLIQEAGRSRLSRGSIADAIQNLKDRKSELEMQRAGVAARQAAIAKRIAEIAQEIEKNRADDPIAKELAGIVDQRQRLVAIQQRIAEKQSYGEGYPPLVEAEEALALAKVQLLQHQQDAARRAGADRMATLNDELAGISMAMVETEAQLQIVERELAELNPEHLLALADRFELEVTIQLPMAQEMFEHAQQRVFDAELRLQAVAEPRVIDLVPSEPEESPKP